MDHRNLDENTVRFEASPQRAEKDGAKWSQSHSVRPLQAMALTRCKE